MATSAQMSFCSAQRKWLTEPLFSLGGFPPKPCCCWVPRAAGLHPCAWGISGVMNAQAATVWPPRSSHLSALSPRSCSTASGAWTALLQYHPKFKPSISGHCPQAPWTPASSMPMPPDEGPFPITQPDAPWHSSMPLKKNNWKVGSWGMGACWAAFRRLLNAHLANALRKGYAVWEKNMVHCCVWLPTACWAGQHQPHGFLLHSLDFSWSVCLWHC